MPAEYWLPLAIASALLLAVPGPAAWTIVSQAQGRKPLGTLAAMLGTIAGGTAALTVALLSVGLAWIAAPTVFAFVKLVSGAGLGIACLLFWRAVVVAAPTADNDNLPGTGLFSTARRGFSAAAFSPRTILFHGCVLAQLADSGQPPLTQAIAFEGIFVALSTVAALACALFSGPVRAGLRLLSKRRKHGRKSGILRVSAGNVTVGYRRLAA